MSQVQEASELVRLVAAPLTRYANALRAQRSLTHEWSSLSLGACAQTCGPDPESREWFTI
jgi:hypothetical protein